MKKTTLYPGSFDPPTNGHLDLVKRALSIFDRVVIAVMINTDKSVLFSVEERKEMLSHLYKNDEKIDIVSYDGLLVNLAREVQAQTILRGLRAVSDFEYEFQMALMNRKLNPDIQSVYLMPSPEFSYLSSSLIKEVYSFGGNIDGLVPDIVEKYLADKLDKNRGNK
ncbi:MAG: pantetheine-phosphate adenylyltransferase [Elusimicrobiota bacterium]